MARAALFVARSPLGLFSVRCPILVSVVAPSPTPNLLPLARQSVGKTRGTMSESNGDVLSRPVRAPQRGRERE
jgi:hypothetical protein